MSTIHLTDTVDSYKRTLMVTRRNGKVTMVQRWKDRGSKKKHCQRFTLDNTTAIDLASAIIANVQLNKKLED